MDSSLLLKPAGVAVLSVLVGILASIGNEVVLVSLLVVLTGILVIWKQNQVLYYLLQERNHVVPMQQVPVSKNSKSTKNKHLNEKNVYSESRDAQKQETLSNRKNEQSKGKNAYLDNSEVEKRENFSKMESKQPNESSEKLMLEAQMSGTKPSSQHEVNGSWLSIPKRQRGNSSSQSTGAVTRSQVQAAKNSNLTTTQLEYTSGYQEMCKYFEEEEDDAMRDKKARLACELRHQGFDLDKVIDAARNCDNFDTATRFLMQKCDSCAKFFSLPEIVQMFMCTHKLCKGCIKNHVAKAIKGRNILDCTCKVCEMPKLEFEDKALEYLSNLDCYLESILPSEIHQQFHRELMSGTWKTSLKSKESKPSSQHEVNGSWLSIPIRQRGNSSSQSTGAVTRSQAQAAKNSNLTTTQIEGSAGTIADNDKYWPKLGSTFNKNSTDLPTLGSESSCSFCGTKTYLPYKMISCEHKLCLSCTTTCFSQLILTADITDCVCPVCRKPEFHSQEDFVNYFIDFRKNLSYIFDARMQQSLERKFQDYIDNMNGDNGTRTKRYADAKHNERDNCNQLQRTSSHKETHGVAPFNLLCGHSRCVDCLKEAISSENVLEFVCDICYKGNREAQLEFIKQDEGFNLRLEEAVGQEFYQIFTSCLDRRIKQKECASKVSSAISSRNSLNDYVEKRQTTCPNCRVHCDLTRQANNLVKCHQCKVSFCETCKASYNNRGERSWYNTRIRINHHEICSHRKNWSGIDKQRIILKRNKVNFVDTEPESGVCLLREVYRCQNKPFRSDLCRYHYEDYLVNLILQNNLKTKGN